MVGKTIKISQQRQIGGLVPGGEEYKIMTVVFFPGGLFFHVATIFQSHPGGLH